MWCVLSRLAGRVSVYIFYLILLVGWVVETHAQPQVDESIRPYLSGAAQNALFGPDPRLVREEKAPEILYEILTQPKVGTNVQVNDSSTESCSTTGCTQSETSIDVDPTNPNNMAVGWNDGVGFFDPSVFDISGFGYSTDGGVTWTDGGTPPNSSSTIRIWGDPAMAICGDGSVHYANLYVDTVGTFSGLSVNNGSFVGGTLVFDPAGPIVAVGNMTDFFDKEYLVCDPLSNTLYMSYTNFIGGVGNGQIEFIRSTDGGVTWSTPIILQAEESIVNQGSYPAVGPGGQVCVAWERDWLGGDPHIAVRCSTDFGAIFGSRVRVGDVGSTSALSFPNGYNSNRINDFPSIAIDTSGGPNNGNIYVAWHSTCEPTFSGTTVTESEPNNSSGTADPMSIGDDYSGDISPAIGIDFVSFSATAGQTIRANVILGTLSPVFHPFLTLYDTDGTTNLASSSNPSMPFIDFTLPSTGTFFLAFQAFGGSGTYTIKLRELSCGPPDNPAREPIVRDIMFARSTDGGATFSSELLVNDDPSGADQWWPWVSVNENGQVGIIWYDRRNDPVANDLTDVFFAQSDDGGATFAPNLRVTDTATSWTGIGSDSVRPNFGDYINLATGGPNFHATWADGRNGDPDVYYASITSPLGIPWTWGYNYYGQLGDDTTTNRSNPVPVSTITDVVAIAGGDMYTIALRNDGTVWTWGVNDYDQLGTTTSKICNGKPCSTLPVQVCETSSCTSYLTSVDAITGGGRQTTALKNDGTVWTWGAPGTTPVQVSGLTDVDAIAGGYYHTIALKNDGTVWTWGYLSTTPVQVSGLTGVDAIAAGGYYHSIALKNDGTVWTWGDNSYGALGDGTTTDSPTPVQVCEVYGVSSCTTYLTGVDAIAGGWMYTIVLKNDGTVWTWGLNDYDQLGATTTEFCNGQPCSTIPLQVSGLTGVTDIDGAMRHTISLKNDGTVWTWGNNDHGRLGNGTTTDSTTPVQVIDNFGNPFSDVVAIAGGGHHTIALKTVSSGKSTSSGTNVVISPDTNVTIIFDNVTSGGDTTVTPVSCSSPPSGYDWGDPSTCYDITTTTTLTGNIEVCINYDPANFTDESAIRLIHDGSPISLQDTTLNEATNIICGVVTSLSEFGVGIEYATLINLTSFTARGLDGKVVLRWETASETDNAGFNIWRIARKGKKYTKYIKINPTLIPAEGSPIQGATYTYIDTNVVNRTIYYYALEDIDIYGVRTYHGRGACTFGEDPDCKPVRAIPHKRGPSQRKSRGSRGSLE